MRRAWARGKAFALVPDVPPPESKAVLCCTAREELMALRLRGGGLVPLYPQGAEERESLARDWSGGGGQGHSQCCEVPFSPRYAGQARPLSRP